MKKFTLSLSLGLAAINFSGCQAPAAIEIVTEKEASAVLKAFIQNSLHQIVNKDKKQADFFWQRGRRYYDKYTSDTARQGLPGWTESFEKISKFTLRDMQRRFPEEAAAMQEFVKEMKRK